MLYGSFAPSTGGGTSQKVSVGSECPRELLRVSLLRHLSGLPSCDTCQDFHARRASNPLPSCTVSNDGLSSAQQTQARALEHMHARARARTRTDAMADAKQHVIASATSATKMKASHVGGLSGARSSSRCATWHGHVRSPPSLGGWASLPRSAPAHLWRVRVLRVAIQPISALFRVLS